MDINGIRTLNLVGTIIFAIFGVIIPLIYLLAFGMIFLLAPASGFFVLCITILLVWIIVIGFLAFKIYQNAVLGLDRGDFVTAKNWTLYGAIIGFIFGGGWLALIIFLISYVSFDDAIWPKPYYYPPSPYHYPYPPTQYPGPGYPPQQSWPTQWCPRCGKSLRYITNYRRWYCDSCKKYA